MRARLFFVAALGVSCACTVGLACSSFSSDDESTTDPDSAAAGDGSLLDTLAPETALDSARSPVSSFPVSTPTELLLDGTTLYIASEGQAIYAWTIGDAAPALFTTSPSAATSMQVGNGRLYFVAGASGVYYARAGGGIDAGTSSEAGDGGDAGEGGATTASGPVACRPGVLRIATFSGFGVIVNANGVATLGLDCVSVNYLTTSHATLVAADKGALLRYTPAAGGGEIDSCIPNDQCGSKSTKVAEMIGPSVTSLVVDDARIYWTTNDGVFSKLKSSGSIVTIATGQKLPKGLAVSTGAIYWTNYDDGTVMTAPGAGGSPPITFAVGIDHPHGIVVTGDDVFVSASGEGRVLHFARR